MDIRFEPVRWSLNTNLYEVNLRQYTPAGTFAAFLPHLHRLRDMGVKTLWFMPVTPISVEKRQGKLGSYYACSSYIQTNPEFGTVEEFTELVRRAHELGFKVIIDWVANHTGWDHEWTRSNPGFYKKNPQGSFYDNNGWLDVIDLNYYDHSMRKAMMGAMEFWVRTCDIDGFRCDMAHLVPLDFWREARNALDQIKPLFWLAETEDNNYQYVFDCSYAWNWMHVTENFARGRASIFELKSSLADYQRKKLPRTNHLFFTSNHDENTWNGTEYEKYGASALAFAVFACTWKGLPLVYSGQELPNRKRLPFFEKEQIEWIEEPELHIFYKTLLGLRNSFGLDQPEVLLLNTAGRNVLAYLKIAGPKQNLVLINLGDAQEALKLEDTLISGMYLDVFTGEKQEAPSIKNISMEPWSFLVLEKL